MKFSTVVENDSLDLDDLEDLAEEAGELAFDLDFFLRVFFGGFGMSGQGTGSEQAVSENKLYTDPSRDCSKSVIWKDKERKYKINTWYPQYLLKFSSWAKWCYLFIFKWQLATVFITN